MSNSLNARATIRPVNPRLIIDVDRKRHRPEFATFLISKIENWASSRDLIYMGGMGARATNRRMISSMMTNPRRRPRAR